MKMHVDIAYRSLNHYGEELCGDKVKIAYTEDSTIAVLADGLGSGVKANILATLTSTIISTMLNEGSPVEEAVETITRTLPVCSVRKLAYSTFTVAQIRDNGETYLVEFDNPPCIFIRDGKVMPLEQKPRVVDGKKIYESRFMLQPGDILTMISDGVVYAGVGQALNFGWNWDNVSAWLARTTQKEKSAPRLASSLAEAVNDLYLDKPGDDSTCLVIRAMPRCVVNMLSGPPVDKANDNRMVHDFITSPGKKMICGGTSANIVARVLNRRIETVLNYTDPTVPPIAKLEGIDLVTEGVLTLSRTVDILRDYLNHDADEDYFRRLDEKNGAAMIARMLLEDCTDLRMFIGRAINPAHQNPGLPADLSIKMKLLDDLSGLVERMGKKVEKIYY